MFAAWRTTAVSIELTVRIQIISFEISIDTFAAGASGSTAGCGLDHNELGLILLRNLRRRQPGLLQRGVLAEQRFLQRPSHTFSLQSVKFLAPRRNTASGTTTTGTTTTGTAGGDKKERDYTLFAPKNSKTHDYHIRLKVNSSSKTAHATVYDSEDAEKKAIDGDTITINIPGDKTPIELKCAEGEKGKCIHFMGKDDRLGSAIDLAKVELKTTIGGKQRFFELDKDD